nr:uncharacterized protein LOC109026002 [Gorilla gorilla gorilla]
MNIEDWGGFKQVETDGMDTGLGSSASPTSAEEHRKFCSTGFLCSSTYASSFSLVACRAWLALRPEVLKSAGILHLCNLLLSPFHHRNQSLEAFGLGAAFTV